MHYVRSDLLGLAIVAAVVRFHPSNIFFLTLAALFFVSLVSNASPFFGASYTVIATTALIAFGFSLEAFILVVAVTAAGAAIGKLVIYSGAGAFTKQLSRNKNVQLIARWLNHRRFLIAVFVTALIPLLPLDDYIYIAAGAVRSRLAPMVSVTVVAKLLKSAVEIELEFLGIINVARIARHFFGISSLDLSAILTLVFVALGIILFKVDWTRFLGSPSVKGAAEQTTPSAGA